VRQEARRALTHQPSEARGSQVEKGGRIHSPFGGARHESASAVPCPLPPSGRLHGRQERRGGICGRRPERPRGSRVQW
jgi:hypothetical protein